MTFFHFINCLTLTYAPIFLSYKYSGLSEYSSIWKCVQAALAYLLTQLAKMLVLATFFPAGELEGQRFEIIPELLKSSVDVLDLIGLHLVIGYSLAGKAEVRFLAAGLGWAAADSVASRLLPFWVGTRGPGFDWKFVRMGLSANVDLLLFVSLATLVWLRSRTDLNWPSRHLVTGLLCYGVLRHFVHDLLSHLTPFSGLSLLLIHLVFALVMTFGATVVYGDFRVQMINQQRR